MSIRNLSPQQMFADLVAQDCEQYVRVAVDSD